MVFDSSNNIDQDCFLTTGDKEDGNNKPCKTSLAVGSDGRDCIFPFYYADKYYDACVVFTIVETAYLPRCPTYNIVTKKDGINSFAGGADPIIGQGFCPTADLAINPDSPLDPNPALFNNCPFERRDPFGQCNNNCPGGEGDI